MLGRSVIGVAMILSSSCPAVQQEARVHYEVRLRDGGMIPVSIRYVLPSGEERTLESTTPWTSRQFTFGVDSVLLIRAETAEEVDSPLLCNFVGTQDEGAWTLRTIGEPLATCGVRYPLGRWPPDDLSGPLIRVG